MENSFIDLYTAVILNRANPYYARGVG